MQLLPLDQLNVLRTKIQPIFLEYRTGKKSKQKTKAEICDEILDLLLLAYTFGCEDANEMLGTEIAPTYEEMRDTVYEKVAGETWEDRVEKYLDEYAPTAQEETPASVGGTTPGEPAVTPDETIPGLGDILRIADTDSHRVYNEAGINTVDVGIKSGKIKGDVMKTWCTMLDPKVREQHQYLEGTTIPFDAEFVTFDGDHGLAPGMLERPESVINCRCYLTYSK